MDVKFAYKRGTFYIIDAFEHGNGNPFNSTETSLEGIRVSNGAITGTVGREVSYSNDTLPPGQYGDALIASRGGYTSRDAQLARHHEKPAVFSFNGELHDGQTLNIEARSVEISTQSNYSEQTRMDQQPQQNQETTIGYRKDSMPDQMAATKIIALNAGNGFYTQPPFRGKYALTDSNVYCDRIKPQNRIQSYADFFRFNGDTAVVDARRMERDGLADAIGYIEAEKKFLIVDELDAELGYAAVESDYMIVVRPEKISETEETMSIAERQYIIEKLRNQSSE
jgi:hypothetical protein